MPFRIVIRSSPFRSVRDGSLLRYCIIKAIGGVLESPTTQFTGIRTKSKSMAWFSPVREPIIHVALPSELPNLVVLNYHKTSKIVNTMFPTRKPKLKPMICCSKAYEHNSSFHKQMAQHHQSKKEHHTPTSDSICCQIAPHYHHNYTHQDD